MKKAILSIFILLSNLHLISQVEYDSVEIAKIQAFDSLVNARLDLYYYKSFDICYVDSVKFSDTIVLKKEWCLFTISYLYCDEKNKKVMHRALDAFLDFHKSNGKVIRLMDRGFCVKYSDANSILKYEDETGYFFVPTNQTLDCMRTPCIKEFDAYINSYNNLQETNMESSSKKKRARKNK